MLRVSHLQGFNAFRAAGGGDPDFSYVTFLSGFEGTDGSTSFTDESSFANACTAVGNAQVDTAQFKYGTSSALFDGTGDWIEIGSASDSDFETPTNTTPFTVECWARFNATTGDRFCFCGAWSGGSPGWIFSFYNGNMEFYNWNYTNITSAAWSPSTGVWYHVALDFDGTKTRLFADGVMVGSVTATQQLVAHAAITFAVGSGGSFGSWPFNGWIDEFRFTNGASRYGSDSSFTPPTTAFPRS